LGGEQKLLGNKVQGRGAVCGNPALFGTVSEGARRGEGAGKKLGVGGRKKRTAEG